MIPLSSTIVVVTRKKISNRKAISAIEPALISFDSLPLFLAIILFIYYYFKSNYEKAKVWYEKLFEEEKPSDKTLLFRYKQSLKAIGEFSEEGLDENQRSAGGAYTFFAAKLVGGPLVTTVTAGIVSAKGRNINIIQAREQPCKGEDPQNHTRPQNESPCRSVVDHRVR